MAELINNIAESSYAGLIGGISPAPFTKNVTLAAGTGTLSQGTVLGKITASGKFTKVDSTSTDGSQTANAVLADDTDISAGDVIATVLIKGCFNREKLIFGGTDTADKHEDALRDMNIYLTSEE